MKNAKPVLEALEVGQDNARLFQAPLNGGSKLFRETVNNFKVQKHIAVVISRSGCPEIQNPRVLLRPTQ